MTTTATDVPDGSVIITPAEMYREMRDTHDLVKRLAEQLTPSLEAINKKTDDHESRLRALEKKVWVAAGAAATVGGLLGSYGQSVLS